MSRKTHKDQHFVAESYLKAWCDRECPKGYKPFVWIFERDGSNPRKRAPSNIFKESEFYTIKKADGTRDLRLEHGLAGLETKFGQIRKDRLEKQQPLTDEEHAYLAAFVAAAQFRTRSSRDHQAQQWQHMLDIADDLAESMKTAKPEQKRAMAQIGSSYDKKGSMSHDQVRQLAEMPIQTMMPGILRTTIPILIQMNMLILSTNDETGFITSDRPVTWFDPEAYKLPPFYRSPGLASPTIEVTMPLSPRQCLVFSKHDKAGYATAPDLALNELNRRHRAHCEDHFIVNNKNTSDYWFQEFELPNDAWEKRQASGTTEE